MGLLHDHQSRLEQLKNKLERQRESERQLRKELHNRREMEVKLRKLKTELKEKESQDDKYLIFIGGNCDLFSEEVMHAKVQRNFKHPDIDPNDRSTDPCNHFSNFKEVY
ncbi:hypothetical protein AHAS_Ahas12G0147300 [Arachis hypogaea]